MGDYIEPEIHKENGEYFLFCVGLNLDADLQDGPLVFSGEYFEDEMCLVEAYKKLLESHPNKFSIIDFRGKEMKYNNSELTRLLKDLTAIHNKKANKTLKEWLYKLKIRNIYMF